MRGPRAKPPCAYTEELGKPVHAGGWMYPEPAGPLFYYLRGERAALAVHFGGGRAQPFSSPPGDLTEPSWASESAYAACTLLSFFHSHNLGQAGYICTQKVGQPREFRGKKY